MKGLIPRENGKGVDEVLTRERNGRNDVFMRMTLRFRILTIGIVLTLVPMAVMSAVVYWQNGISSTWPGRKPRDWPTPT